MNKNAVKKLNKEGDFGLGILTLAISLFGVIMVFSASYYESLTKYGTEYHYLIDAIMWFVAGWVVYLLCSIINFRIYRYLAIVAIIVAFGLLFLLYTPLAATYNNATRWLVIGPITIMPGEVFKTAAILFFAWLYSKEENAKNKTIIVGSFILIGIAAYIIYRQPNLSTALILCAIVLGIMFVAGITKWLFLGLIALAVPAVFILLKVLPGYMLDRITSFLDPWADALGSGYQVCQGLIALGSGGFLGLGIGNSIQKAYYLPEPQNDFILTIIGEELGFVGIVILLITYMALIFRIISISLRCPNRFGSLFAAGVGIHFALQVVLNLAVCVSAAPATGVTLPLISLGGNSFLLFMAELGIVQNISKSADKIL